MACLRRNHGFGRQVGRQVRPFIGNMLGDFCQEIEWISAEA